MANIEDSLSECIKELSLLFDRLSANYESIKLKILALIAGEVAIAPFIFSSEDKLIPSEAYGIVFFSIGLASFALSFGILLWAISTASWTMPMEVAESKKLSERYKKRIDFLKYLQEDYEESILLALKLIKIRARAFNISLILFAAGTIILFVLKYIHGGTQ